MTTRNIIVLLAMASLAPAANAAKPKLLGAKFSAPTINGKDNVYQPEVGEIIYDSSDKKFYGRAENESTGVPMWSLLTSNNGGSSLPAGAVIAFAAACPTGYVLADGKSYATTGDMSTLYAAISTTHGNGTVGESGETGCPSPSGCFNVPDYRGRFLRGVDGAANRDQDKAGRTEMATGGQNGNAVGSVQGHAFQTHNHTQNPHGHTIPSANGTGGGGPQLDAGNLFSNGNFGSSYSTNTVTATNNVASASGANSQASSNETRPVNAYVNFCVKL